MCNDNGAVIFKMLSEIFRLNDEPVTVEPPLTAAFFCPSRQKIHTLTRLKPLYNVHLLLFLRWPL